MQSIPPIAKIQTRSMAKWARHRFVDLCLRHGQRKELVEEAVSAGDRVYLRAHSIPSSRAESSKNQSYKWDPTTLLSVGGCMICIGIERQLEQSHLQLHWGHQVCRGNPRSKDMNFGTCGQSWTHSTFHDSRSVSRKPHFSTSRSLVQISKKAYLFGK